MPGFNNPIVGGGGALVYPSIHSPNFASGVSGWSVDKNGNAEFNNVSVTGTFEASNGAGRYAQLESGELNLGASGELQAATFTEVGPGQYNAQSGIQSLADQAAAFYLSSELASGLGFPVMQIRPGTIVIASKPNGFPETWNAMTLTGGWTGTAQYKLMPDGTVMIRTSVSSIGGGTNTNGTVIWTAPAGYVPAAAQQSIPLVISAVGAGSAASALTPFLEITSAGALSVNNIAAQNATNLRFCGRYALD